MSKPRKGKKMSKDLDLDLGLEEIAGEIKESVSPHVEEPKAKKSSGFTNTLAKASKRARESVKTKTPNTDNCGEFFWIATPEYNTVEHVCSMTGEVKEIRQETGKIMCGELESCSAQEFSEWLKYVWPPSREVMTEKDVKYYEDYDARKQAFANVISFWTQLPKRFKEGSHMQDVYSKKKKKVKKGEK